MHIKSKFKDTLEAIKKNEEKFTELVKSGSKDPLDYHYMSYFSGMHNGFNLVWKALDGLSEEEYDELVGKMLQ